MFAVRKVWMWVLMGVLAAIVPTMLPVWSQTPSPFLEQCLTLETLTPEARHTVQILLAVAGTKDCPTAATILGQQVSLVLSDRQIKDLTPLATLPHLETLYLESNQIETLLPLAALKNLEALYLRKNQIQSLAGISTLKNLVTLSLDENPLTDLDGISDLPNLKILYANSLDLRGDLSASFPPQLSQLYLANNQLTSVEAIANLTQLTVLDLSNNRLDTVAPLAQLANLTELDVGENQITDVNVLASLKQLTRLDLRNNPLIQKTCPVFPATVCQVSDDGATLFQQGNQQFARGEYRQAVATFQQVQQVYEANGDRLRESAAWDRQGNSYDALGEYANALLTYETALALKTVAGDRPGEADSQTNLGITYLRLGQVEKAIAALQAAWEIQQSLAIQDEPRAGRILSGLALAYSQTGDDKAALTFAKLSLASHRRGSDRAGEAIALVRVGNAYLKLGNPDKARRYFERALELSQRLGDRASIARSYHALGNWAFHTGDWAQAERQYQLALSEREAIQDAAGQGETLNALGALHYAQGDLPLAIATLNLAVERWEALRPGLTDENKISIAETQAETYRQLQQALIESGEITAALEIAERGRARAFTELLTHRLKLQGKLPGTRSTEVASAPGGEEIQRLAQTRHLTLLEYSFVGEELYLWVVTPDGKIHFHSQSLAGEPWQTWVTDTRAAMGVPFRGGGLVAQATQDAPLPDEQIRDRLSRLYQVLIAPVAQWLPENSTDPVVIIPQGDLYLVPFAALLDSHGKPLIEQHGLLFSPAIRLLLTNRLAPPALRLGEVSALVVGNPLMPVDPNTGQPLPPLLGAKAEAEEIAALLKTEPLLGAEATKEAVIERMPSARIIHLATHGLLDDFGTGVPGALAFSPTETDNGYLTAAELLEMPLSAQLVVLSACDTGQGSITGDGVVGLSRSLLTAGVETVVVSLWSVPDEATRLLMTTFYQALQSTQDSALALQQAMLTTRAQYPNPVFWSAFTVYGSVPTDPTRP